MKQTTHTCLKQHEAHWDASNPRVYTHLIKSWSWLNKVNLEVKMKTEDVFALVVNKARAAGHGGKFFAYNYHVMLLPVSLSRLRHVIL